MAVAKSNHCFTSIFLFYTTKSSVGGNISPVLNQTLKFLHLWNASLIRKWVFWNKWHVCILSLFASRQMCIFWQEIMICTHGTGVLNVTEKPPIGYLKKHGRTPDHITARNNWGCRSIFDPSAMKDFACSQWDKIKYSAKFETVFKAIYKCFKCKESRLKVYII